MSREHNHPDLENPPYCKAVIEHFDDGEQKTDVVKGFLSIQYLYAEEHPHRLSVIYTKHQEYIPDDAEWIGDQPEGGTKSYELIFNDAVVREVAFEEEWDYEIYSVEE